MSANAVINPKALRDLKYYYFYIGHDNPLAAERLVRAFYEDAQKLAAMPGMGAKRHFKRREYQGLRSCPIKGFRNYLIFYRPTANGIEVLRVIHGARDIERALETDYQ